MKFLLLIAFGFVIFSGCSFQPTYQGYLTKDEVLEIDPNADAFEFDGNFFKTGIDWIDEEELTKDEQIAVITKEMATVLPNGALVYSTKERGEILIVEYNGTEKRYLLVAGE